MRHKGNCPYCNHNDEDNEHILLCPHNSTVDKWNIILDNFIKKLEQLDTCWYVKVAIKKELQAWRRNRILPNTNKYPTELEEAIHEQRQIGWRSFLEGTNK